MPTTSKLDKLKDILAPEHAPKKELVFDEILRENLKKEGIFLSQKIIEDTASSFGFSTSKNALTIEYIARDNFYVDSQKQELQLNNSTTHVVALDQENLQVQAIFKIDDGGNLSVIIVMRLMERLGKPWQFQTGFPILDVFGNQPTFPFDKIRTESAYYIYSSNNENQKIKPWPLQDDKDQKYEEIEIAQGLNLAARVELSFFSEAYTAIAGPNKNQFFLFYGKISRDLEFYPDYPFFDLQCPLDTKSLTISGESIPLNEAALHISISKAEYGPPNCSASLEAQSTSLIFGLKIQNTVDSVILFVNTKNNIALSSKIDEKIPLFPTKSEITEEKYIISELEKFFTGIGLRSFYLVFYKPDGSSSIKILKIGFSVGATTKEGWTLYGGERPEDPSTLSLKDFSLNVDAIRISDNAYAKNVSFSASANLFPKIFPGNFYFYIATDNVADKWQLRQISGGYAGSVKLIDIWKGIAGTSFNEKDFPEVLKDITFSDFDITLINNSGYTYSISGNIDANLPLNNNAILACSLTVQIGLTSGASQNRSKVFGINVFGVFVIDQHEFNLELKFSTGRSKFILSAEWEIKNSIAGDSTYDQSDDDQTDTEPREREKYLQLSDIAEAFGFYDIEIPEVFKTIDISLEAAKVYYDYSENILFIACKSATHGAATFIAANPKNETGGWRFFFGLDIKHKISLGDFKLFKNLATSNNGILEIKNIKTVFISKPFSAELIDNIQSIFTDYSTDTKDTHSYPRIPNDNNHGIGAGFGFSMDVVIGGEETHLTIGKLYADGTLVNPYNQSSPDVLQPSVGTAQQTTLSAESNGNSEIMASGYWVKIEKSFGPFYIEKVGIEFDGWEITLMANMALAAAGVSIDLIGFGAKINFKEAKDNHFIPDFTLQGLSVAYASGPLTISGGLMGKLKPELDLVGQLIVKSGDFGISALAGYADYNNKPALFIYAVLNAPLGGPPFFFVTGIAGGFGFNYQLITPSVDQISIFPLIKLATGDEAPPAGKPSERVSGMLSKLSSVLFPSIGQYWLAAGIQFTSFQIAHSTALAIVKFGESLEIDLLGQTTIQIPPRIPGTKNTIPPVIFVTLQLLASFKPAEGFLGISGQLSNNSYILSENCHLTGGFAYYMWFSGPYSGDFVITMGGYKRGMAIPRHYPQVPRLGVNWQILPLQSRVNEPSSSQLSMKGELYFAITSSMAMMGGSFTFNWTSEFIQATFTANIDFSVNYEPFYYQASAYIEVSVAAKIRAPGTGIDINAKANGSIEIWGPEFTGKALFRFGSISHEITFGVAKKEIQPLLWPEFVVKLLKIQSTKSIGWVCSNQATQQWMQDSNKGIPEILTNGAGIYVDITKGLIKKLDADQSQLVNKCSDQPSPAKKSNSPDFLVNGSTFEMTIKTTIPIKEKNSNFHGLAQLAPTEEQPHACQSPTFTQNNKCAEQIILGAGEQPSDKCKNPVEILPATDFGVGPVKWAKDKFFPRLVITITKQNESANVNSVKKLNCIRILSNAPQSLWQDASSETPSNSLANTTICNTLSGYRIKPIIETQIQFCSKLDEFWILVDQVDKNIIRWSSAYIPQQHNDFENLSVEGTIATEKVNTERNLILDAINNNYGTSFAKENIITHIKDLDLLDRPIFRLLGAQYQANPAASNS